jgi:hypothetical protein
MREQVGERAEKHTRVRPYTRTYENTHLWGVKINSKKEWEKIKVILFFSGI